MSGFLLPVYSFTANPCMQTGFFIPIPAWTKVTFQHFILVLTFTFYSCRMKMYSTNVERMMIMNESSKITEAEWNVMRVLWDKGPVTSSEIVEILKPTTQWSTTTIYTLINRLVNKKAVAIKEGSSPNLCYALISKNELRKKENESFLKKVYDGSLNLMLANIVESEPFSDKEIEELKKILDESKDRRK